MLIRGKRVRLQPATEDHRRMVYEWLAESDITRCMMGPPHFPDHPKPTWEEFRDGYEPYFFDDSEPELGRCFIIMVDDVPVGTVSYNEIDKEHRRTELDIWMSCEANCGQGYGTEALQLMYEYLFREYGVVDFWMQPSARNPRAIRAYQKAISLDPDYRSAYFNLSVVYFNQKQYELAIKYYDQAIRLGHPAHEVLSKHLKPYRKRRP